MEKAKQRATFGILRHGPLAPSPKYATASDSDNATHG